jgi:CheY-like chemotaxis protein
MPLKMLIVDDEETIRWALRELFLQDGWEVHCAEDGDQAVSLVGQDVYDFMITDLKMPGRNGVEVVREARRSNPEMGVLVLTGYATLETAIEALRLRAWDYVTKPCDVRMLRQTIAEFQEARRRPRTGRLRRRPLTGDEIDHFLGGGGTEVLAPWPLYVDERCREPLERVQTMFADLGMAPGRAQELLQPCVEAVSLLGDDASGGHGRAGVLRGYVIVAVSGRCSLGCAARQSLDRIAEQFGVDVRVTESGGVHSITLSEAVCDEGRGTETRRRVATDAQGKGPGAAT